MYFLDKQDLFPLNKSKGFLSFINKRKPAIVSNTSGIASYVNEDLGLVVPADSEDALGQNMIEIYQQYSKYDSDRIKKFAMDHFSDKAILEKLRKMYSENK